MASNTVENSAARPSAEVPPKKKKSFTKKILSKSTYRPVTNLFRPPGFASRSSSRSASLKGSASSSMADLQSVGVDPDSPKASARSCSGEATVDGHSECAVEDGAPEEAESSARAASGPDTAAPGEVDIKLQAGIESSSGNSKSSLQSCDASAAENDTASNTAEHKVADISSETPPAETKVAELQRSTSAHVAATGVHSDQIAAGLGTQKSEPSFDLGMFLRNTLVPLLSCGIVPPMGGHRHADSDAF